VSRSYRVVLFDLFGTVVHFVPPPPDARQQVYEWLRAALARHRPAIPFEDFRSALLEVSAAIAAERAPEHREVSSPDRFRRALARFGGADDDAVGEAIARIHMTHLADQTTMPSAHLTLLNDIAARYRVGLVSNFDHGPTAQAILARHGVHRCFDVTLISDDFGRRKPHPSIFQEALTRLGATADEALYVGDSANDDVAGAQAVGLDVAWVNRTDREPPEPPPTHILRQLTDIRPLLGI
jgi:FMN phosphatase YigB (HAD superfamily)